MKEVPRSLSAFELNDWLQGNLEDPILIDVREDKELDIAPFPYKVVHLPLSKFSEWIENLADILPVKKNLVVICHAGVRSWNFCNCLIDQSWDGEIWNLEGGIESWSSNVDPNVPRY